MMLPGSHLYCIRRLWLLISRRGAPEVGFLTATLVPYDSGRRRVTVPASISILLLLSHFPREPRYPFK